MGRNVPMIRRREFLLRVLEQALERLDALVAGNEFAFSNRDFFLEGAVLLDELALDDGELFEVALEEHHLLLLRTVVGGAEHVVVLLAGLV
jgi:hypothetical protein